MGNKKSVSLLFCLFHISHSVPLYVHYTWLRWCITWKSILPATWVLFFDSWVDSHRGTTVWSMVDLFDSWSNWVGFLTHFWFEEAYFLVFGVKVMNCYGISILCWMNILHNTIWTTIWLWRNGIFYAYSSFKWAYDCVKLRDQQSKI